MILLVDDDDDIRQIGLLSLHHVGGWEVREARSGPEAFAQIAAQRPKLILLDVMMPGQDGPSVLAQLRATPELADIPVVFMTAKVQSSEVQLYLQLGAVDVITKPFDPMTLPDRVRGILAKKTS